MTDILAIGELLAEIMAERGGCPGRYQKGANGGNSTLSELDQFIASTERQL